MQMMQINLSQIYDREIQDHTLHPGVEWRMYNDHLVGLHPASSTVEKEFGSSLDKLGVGAVKRVPGGATALGRKR